MLELDYTTCTCIHFTRSRHFADIPVFWMTQNIFASFGYPNIYRWGGSSSQFSLVIWDSEGDATFDLILHTGQAPDMAALILDYITAIMDAQ